MLLFSESPEKRSQRLFEKLMVIATEGEKKELREVYQPVHRKRAEGHKLSEAEKSTLKNFEKFQGIWMLKIFFTNLKNTHWSQSFAKLYHRCCFKWRLAWPLPPFDTVVGGCAPAWYYSSTVALPTAISNDGRDIMFSKNHNFFI